MLLIWEFNPSKMQDYNKAQVIEQLDYWLIKLHENMESAYLKGLRWFLPD